jgi:hypothetical protein
VGRAFAEEITARQQTAPQGIGGWSLIYVIGRAGLLAHQLQLTVGAIVI